MTSRARGSGLGLGARAGADPLCALILLDIYEAGFAQPPYQPTWEPTPPRGGREIAGTPDLARIGVVPPPHICGGLRNTPILARSGVRPSE